MMAGLEDNPVEPLDENHEEQFEELDLDEPAENPVDEPAEEPADEPLENPVDELAEEPLENLVDAPVDGDTPDKNSETKIEPLIIRIESNSFDLIEIFLDSIILGMLAFLLMNNIIPNLSLPFGVTTLISVFTTHLWFHTEGFQRTPAAVDARKKLELVESAERFFKLYDKKVAESRKGDPSDPGFLKFTSNGKVFAIHT